MSPRGKRFSDRFEDAPDADQLAFGLPPSTHTPDGDMTDVVNELVARYPEALGHLKNVRLIVLRRSSRRTDNEFHVESASGAFIRSDRERSIRPDIDGGIWLQGSDWDRFSPHQRRAWVHGLLLRLGLTRDGRLKKLRPEVVEWAQIVAIYGAWQDTLKLFGEGLDAHEKPGPRPAGLALRAPAVPPVSQPN
jgi:hypothetical protein